MEAGAEAFSNSTSGAWCHKFGATRPARTNKCYTFSHEPLSSRGLVGGVWQHCSFMYCGKHARVRADAEPRERKWCRTAVEFHQDPLIPGTLWPYHIESASFFRSPHDIFFLLLGPIFIKQSLRAQKRSTGSALPQIGEWKVTHFIRIHQRKVRAPEGVPLEHSYTTSERYP